tara:strand:- start:119 stop:445 length:327 start_codon:yes stop_codon:yes gene_type:complete
MKKNQKQNLNNIRQAKELEYGSFDDNMNNIGRMWSSLLGIKEDIPGWLVSNMYVAAKLIRTKTKFKEDSYLDAENYLYQAKLMQEKDKGIYRNWLVGYNKWKKNGRNN